MGVDYSYDCILVENVRPLDTFGNKQTLLADMQFEDEHEHPMAVLRDVLVVLEDGEVADLADYPENFLPEDADEETQQRYQKLCEKYPGYHANDDVAFAEQVLDAMPDDPESGPGAAAARRLGQHARKPLSTHGLAQLLLQLPDQPLQLLQQQGGPESWSPELYEDYQVQVGIRTW